MSRSRCGRQVSHRLRFESLEQRHLLAAEGLISHWPLDRTTNPQFDEGPAQNDLFALPPGPREDSDLGRALVLTGQSPPPTIQAADLNLDVSNAITVSGWFKAAEIQQGGFVFAIAPAGLQLRPTASGLKMHLQTADGGGGIIDHQLDAPFEFHSGQWYHLVATYNGEALVAYVNGDEIGRESVSGNLKIDGDLMIGSGSTINDPIVEFRGSLDEFQLYGRALTAQQVGVLFETPSVLETSNEAAFFNAENDPVRVDPGVKITSERANFQGGFLTAQLAPTAQDGDMLIVSQTDQIEIEGNSVFFRREGQSSRIGERLQTSDLFLQIAGFTEAATPEAVQALARAISYTTTAENPADHDRMVGFTLATHRADVFADESTIRLSIPTSETLLLATSEGASQYDPAGESILVDPHVEVESTSANFAGGSLTVSFVQESGRESDRLLVRSSAQIIVTGDLVRYVPSQAAPVVIGEFVGGGNGSPLVIQLNEHATPAATQALARAIRYESTAAETPDHDRWVLLKLDDGQEQQTSDSKRIEIGSPTPVNQPPEIAVPEGATLFNPGSPPVAVLPSVDISDPDSPNFAGGSLRVSFAEESATAGDRLSVANTPQIFIDGGNVFDSLPDPPVRIGEVTVAETGREVIFHFNERVGADFAEMIALTVRYGNERADVVPGDRLIQFVLFDGDGGEDVAVRRVEVAEVSAIAPTIHFSDGTTTFTEGGENVLIDASVEIGDTDSHAFGGGKLVAGFAEDTRSAGDQLGLRSSAGITIQDGTIRQLVEGQSIKIADFVIGEGILTIEFNAEANVDSVQRVARRITFGNELSEPDVADRLVRFTVTDPDGETADDVRTLSLIAVNDAPNIEFADGPTVLEDETEPVLIDPQVEVNDPDSESFDGGKLIANFVEESRQEGDQLLIVSSPNLVRTGNEVQILNDGQALTVGTVSIAEGALVIDFNERASAATVQMIARHIAFGSELEEVATGDRFVRFTVSDGDGGEDFDVKRMVVETNDHPVVVVAEPPTTFQVPGEAVIVAPHVEISDADSVNFAGGTLSFATVEETGAAGDFFAVREGEGIEQIGNRVFHVVNDDALLLGELRQSGEGNALTIDLTEQATPELTQRLARRIVFGSQQTTADDHETRLVRITVTDGDGGSGHASKRIDVIEPDGDLDGVDDEVEGNAPNGGDGNSDGIPDSEQGHVASLMGSEDRFVTFASPETTRLLNVRPLDNPSPSDEPLATTFPAGFFDFEVDGVAAVHPTMVTIYLEPGTSANSYYVFGPTPDDPTPHWYAFTYNGETGAKIFADRIEVYYIDGQRGDSDLIANGVIVDPGAPSLTAFPWQNPDRKGDVNNDGIVSALDALLIINDLIINDTRDLPFVAQGVAQLAEIFLDVTGDNRESALDALQVINLLIQDSLSAQSEAESIEAAPKAMPVNYFGHDWRDDDEDEIWDQAIIGFVNDGVSAAK